jgi:alkylated DNA repair dioxygenase AlkB
MRCPWRYLGAMANTRSLLWQPSLLDASDRAPGFDAQFTAVRRVELDESAWVEHVPGWVHGAGALFAAIVERAPWTQRRVHMYERMVDEPRLIAWYGVALDDPSLPSVIEPMAGALSARYGREFDGVGAALYRDGRDSVAWHGDRIPAEIIDPVVALISLGSPRTLRMRCKSRHRETRAFTFVPGDLFVMGGASQRTWEHSVPKVASAGPRLSLQFRHSR